MNFEDCLNNLIKTYKREHNASTNAIADRLVDRYRGNVDSFGKSTVNAILKGEYKHYSLQQVKALGEFFGSPNLLKYFLESRIQTEDTSDKKEAKTEEIDSSKKLKLSELSDLLAGYQDFDSPQLVLCDQNSIVEYILQKLNLTYYDAGSILSIDDADKIPHELIYCHITASPMSQEVSELFSTAILLMQTATEHKRPKHVIMAVETRDYADIDMAHEIYGKQHHTYKFSMDRDFWIKWLVDVQYDIDYELRGFIKQTLNDKNSFFIPNWEHTFDIAQKAVDVMANVVNKSPKEKLMRIAETGLWKEFFAFVMYLMDETHEDKGQLIKEAQEHARLYHESVDTDIQGKFEDGYKQLESFSKRPFGFAKCNHRAYLYALEKITNILDISIFWSDEYKQEVESWLRFGNIENIPSLNNEEWAARLNKQYKKHTEYLATIKQEPGIYKVWKHLCNTGFPANWFDDDCCNVSILRALSVYTDWKKNLETRLAGKKSDQFNQGKINMQHLISKILWYGDVEERSCDEWKEYFDEQFIRLSTPYDFNFSIEVSK